MSQSINALRVWGRAQIALQADRWLLWTPIAFGAGAAIYFGLKVEPPLWPALVFLGVSLAAAIGSVRWGQSRALIAATTLFAFAGAGLTDGALATRLAAAPRIPAGYGVGVVEGFVVDVSSPAADRGRLLIAPTAIARLDPSALPARVRVVVKPEDVVAPGQAVRLTALLNPPPRPAAPGGFDFARDAWFERIGGVGLALRPPRTVDLPEPGFQLRAELWLNALRWRVASRLADDIARFAPGAGAGAQGLVATVATSHEDWLPAEDEDGLRGSGLAHMLAIAGLHTAAVSGFVFGLLRLGVAAWPWLALRVNGKKVAAAGALLAVMGYLALSGAHPPAERAAITAGVAFAAMLLDRRAISLRSLAIAALLVLALQPEAVVQPGFQMSFCATGALVALAEVWRRRTPTINTPSLNVPWPIRAVQTVRDWLVALAVVSFVAGAATGPFAIQHFNRMANYGVFANLTADLLASAVMMPALALSLPFEALGFGRDLLAAPLAVAGWAARAILEIGRFCTLAPGAAVAMPSAPEAALLLSFLGIVFGIVWKGRLRFVGIPMAFAVLLWPRPALPVAWIANDGNGAAVVAEGAMVSLKPGRGTYATDLWSARRGLRHADDELGERDQRFDCDREGCTPLPGTYPALGAWWSARRPPMARLADLCAVSQIVVLRAEVVPPPACDGRTVLTPHDFDMGGAVEVYAAGAGFRLVWAEPIRGQRPWSGASEAARDREE